MNSLLLYSWGEFWIDLNKTPAHTALTVTLLLMVVMTIITPLLPPKRIFNYFEGIVFICIGLLETYSYYNSHPNEPWMLDSIGNFFFGIGVVIVAIGMWLWQKLTLFDYLNFLSNDGDDFRQYYEMGFYSFIVAAFISLIIALFNWNNDLIIVIIPLALFQLWTILYPIYSAIKKKGPVVDAIIASITYSAGMAGLIFLFAHFILPVIILILIYASGQGKRIENNTKVTLTDGRELYHDGGDYFHDSSGNHWNSNIDGTYSRM